MPRETWSIEIQADISKALGQLQTLRSQIASLGSGASMIRPQFDASGVQKGVNTMNTALNKGHKRATGFISGLQEDFGNFGRIFASRIAFTFATAVERFIIGSLLLIPKAFAGAVRAGAQFESAIRKTATVAAGGFGDIESAMSVLGATAREVGATTTFTAVEVATAMFELVSVGLSVSETQTAIASSAQLAIAIQTDLGTAIDITTQIMKAFGLNASAMADVGDKLTFAIDTTTLNVTRLQAALRFAAPAAGALGISFDDMLTVVAKFVDVTKRGGIAGRAFRFMISALADPTREAANEIRRLGLTTEQVDPQINSLTDIMKRFAFTALDGGSALTIFGKRAGGTVAGAIADIRLGLAAGVDELEKFKEGLTESSRLDLAQKQFQEFMRTLVSQWKIFVSKITELGLQIFDVIGPVAISTMVAVNKLLDALIFIAPALKVFLSLMVSISAVKFVGTLSRIAKAMMGFARATVAANTAGAAATGIIFTQNKAMAQAAKGAGKTSGAMAVLTGGIFAQNKAMVKAAKGAGATSGTMTRLTVITSRLIPIIKKFAGRAGIVGVITGFVLWVKQSALLNETLTFFKNFIVSLIPSMESFDEITDYLNKKWLFMKDMFDTIINQGFDIFISILLGLFGKLTGVIADMLSGLGLLDESNSTLRNMQEAARDAAEHVLKLSNAQGEVRESAGRMESAILTLNEALKIQITSLDTFRTKEAAVVQSFNNLTDSGTTQKDAIFLLQDALRDLFLNSELVSGEYSNSLVPIMDIAAERFNFAGVAAETTAEKVERLASAFSSIFGTSAPEVKDALDEIFDALSQVKNSTGELTDNQFLALVKRLNELEQAAEDAGLEMDDGLSQRFNLARLAAQALSGDIQVLAVDAVDASGLIGGLPKAISDIDAGFPTFKTLSQLITDVKDKFNLARILISQGLAPPGTIASIGAEFAVVAESFVAVQNFSGQTSDEFLEMATNLGFVRQEGESVELFTRRIADSAKDADNAYSDFFENVRRGISLALGELLVQGKSFGVTMKRLLGGVFAFNLAQGFEDALGAFSKLREGGGSVLASLKKGVGEFRKQLDGPLNAAIIGTRAAMGGWQDIGMGALSAISNFAKGDWVAGIMASIGSIVGALRNLFGGTTATKELKKLGLVVSEELTKKIEDAEKALGDYGAAIRTNLVDIIKEQGIPTIKELNQFIAMNRTLLSDLDRGILSSSQAMDAMNASMTELIQSAIDLNSPQGFAGIITTLTDVIARVGLTGASMITAADATKLLNDQFPALVEAAQGFGAAGAAGLRRIIEEARAAGLEIESLNAFVIEKAGSIISNIQDLVGSGMELTAEQVQFAARAMSTAFAEMRASGMTIPEIIDQMGDSIAQLRDRAKELGIKLPQSFNLIAGLGKLFKNEFVKPQLDGLAAIAGAFQSMIELGLKPTQKDFGVLTDQAKKTFKTMIKQGASGKKALLAIAPTLALIRDNAAKFGLTIDKNTQKLIDQAEESGVLAKAALSDGDIMKTGFDNIGKAINRLIETLGGVPIALKEFGDETKVQSATMQNEFVQTGMVLKNEVIAGLQTAQSEMSSLGDVAGEQMDRFAASADDAVNSALRDFKGLKKELVGNTIIKDIAVMGSGFMKDWGDFTHNVVVKVGDDFEKLGTDTIGSGNGLVAKRQGVFGIPEGILNGGSTAAAPVVNVQPSGLEEPMLTVLSRIAKAVESGQNVRVSIDPDGITRQVKKDLIDDSVNGRLILDEGVVQQLQG